MTPKIWLRSIAAAATLATVLVGTTGVAHAGKPRGGSSSLRLVLVSSPDSVANWGETITFDVTSPVYKKWVHLTCTQGGSGVYTSSAGFFPEYPWTKNFILRSDAWTAGAADCSARLYTTTTGTRTTTLATLGFHVYA